MIARCFPVVWFVFKTDFFKIQSLCAEMNSLAHFGGWLVGWSISRKRLFVILLAS